MMEKDRLLNMKQAARILGVKPKTLYQWKWQRNYLPFVKIGKSLRVSERDLDEFIKKSKVK